MLCAKVEHDFMPHQLLTHFPTNHSVTGGILVHRIMIVVPELRSYYGCLTWNIHTKVSDEFEALYTCQIWTCRHATPTFNTCSNQPQCDRWHPRSRNNVVVPDPMSYYGRLNHVIVHEILIPKYRIDFRHLTCQLQTCLHATPTFTHVPTNHCVTGGILTHKTMMLCGNGWGRLKIR